MTVELILESNFGVSEEDEVSYITKILVDDGHIEPDKSGKSGLFSITRKGQKFVDEVGYENGQMDIKNKRVIDQLTIKSLRRSNISIWLSVIAIGVSIAALIFGKS